MLAGTEYVVVADSVLAAFLRDGAGAPPQDEGPISSIQLLLSLH
jgi:hypothetical protein